MRVKDRPGGTSGVACAPLPAICRAAAACAPQRAANRRHLTSTSHASSAALATCAGLGRRHATHAAPYAHGLGLLSARAPRAAPTAPRRWRRTHACPLGGAAWFAAAQPTLGCVLRGTAWPTPRQHAYHAPCASAAPHGPRRICGAAAAGGLFARQAALFLSPAAPQTPPPAAGTPPRRRDTRTHPAEAEPPPRLLRVAITRAVRHGRSAPTDLQRADKK